MSFDMQILDAPTIEVDDDDLARADRITYLIEQSFTYVYGGPVEQLRHCLVVVPPDQHGDQHLRAHRLDVDGAEMRRETRRDARGNTVVRLSGDRVEQCVRFRLAAMLERVRSDGPIRLPVSALTDPQLQRPTPLTTADARLSEFAWSLPGHDDTPTELAARICRAVHAAITYEYGATSVLTTAAEAFGAGRGVCQDAAHIMLAICRLRGLPARYVSGHLRGQGGTHAWVEVVMATDGGAVALPFDPSNGVAASARYLTVATGRDYADVAPTSGSYLGPALGQLTTSRRVAVLSAA